MKKLYKFDFKSSQITQHFECVASSFSEAASMLEDNYPDANEVNVFWGQYEDGLPTKLGA